MQSGLIERPTRLSRPVMVSGFLLGLVLSVSVLSGDTEGRVNLMYLLLVFLFVPLLGAVVSVFSLVKGKGINITRLVTALPVWSKHQQAYFHKIRQMKLEKPWLFLQSQAAALAYSVASLLAFLVLLITTDVNVVWRSTLLDAQQLLPVLQFISQPWWMWEAAQPTLDLLRDTQDSRLISDYQNVDQFGLWWPFVLATQIVYCFILRGLMLITGTLWMKHRLNTDVEHRLQKQRAAAPKLATEQHTLSPVTHHLPEHYLLVNWAGVDESIVAQLKLNPDDSLMSSPLTDPRALNKAEQHSGDIVLLVKAWEPPMGELKDFAEVSNGVIFPVNYSGQRVMPPQPNHLEEWQRFAHELQGWQIYVSDHYGE